MGTRDRWPQFLRLVVPPALAAAGGLLLIAQWAAARPLWLDEEMIAINLRDRSVGQLTGSLALGQTAPYGWLVLQRIVLVLAGDGERALRAVPLLFGLAALAAAWWIGRRWLTPPAAILLVALCAFGQWLTFYDLELKPYSADAFFALLLPALAARAVEDRRSTWTFWLAAAVGQWFGNGALLVTPASAAVLIWFTWRREGRRAAVRALAPGAVWIALFALHYGIALRHAIGNTFLQSTWAFALPPSGSSWPDRARWILGQLAPLAAKPGGAGIGLLFWVACGAGFVLAAPERRVFALAFALVPMTAFALAALRLVPLYERVSIWIVPALYVGLALLADAAGRRGRAIAVLGVAAAAAIGVDVVVRGLRDLPLRPAASNRSLDDRAAVRWLQARGQPDDARVATHFSLPALWWYSGTASTAATFEISYRPDRSECPPDTLKERLQLYPRVAVYLGFRFDDAPPGFDDLLVDRLSELGAVTDYRRFDVRSVALIVDLRQRPNRPATLSGLDARPHDDAIRAPGCIAIAPAAVW